MRVLATGAFSFSASIFAAICLKLDAAVLPLAAGSALTMAAAAVALGRWPRVRRRVVLVSLGMSAGFLWTGSYAQLFFRPAQELDGQTVVLHATVADYPQEETYGGFSLPARVETDGLVRPLAVLYVDEQGAGLRPGDEISAVVHYTLANRSFSGEEITYYTAKGIFLRGEVYGRLDVCRPEQVPVQYWPAVLAGALKKGIARAFPQREAGIVQGIVTGNRDNLTDEFTSSLQRVGMSHTVAVSGMHLAFLAQGLVTLRGRGRRSTAVLTILWAVLFSALCGHTPSVDRAAMMIVLLQIAPLFNRERDLPTSLGFALMVLLLLNPYAAAHIGLQLSFAAVAGIALASDKIQDWLLGVFHLERHGERWTQRILKKIPRFCVSTLSATLGASVLTVPLVAFYFDTCSLISPLANLLTLWAVGFIFVGGLLVGAVAVALPELGEILAVPVVWLVRYVENAVGLLAVPNLSALSMECLIYRAWLVFIYLLLAAALICKGKKRPWIPLCAGVSTLCLSVLAVGLSARMGEMLVAVLDVGQGQSVVLYQKNLYALVDCGGNGEENAGDVAADYLQSRGVSRLDMLILTHLHEDHANGVPRLLERLRVETIYLPEEAEDSALRREILELADEKRIAVVTVTRDLSINTGQGQAVALYAPVEESGETNERGLTVLADGGSFRALMTGDMGAAGEEALLNIADLAQTEVLVVGHHGSDTSTTQALLDLARPEYALISVGEHNLYGHPAQETLERLEEAGAEVYRTDWDGTIEIKK